MFQYLILLTSFIGAASGVWVLAHGDWRKLTLKYAGVSISTVCAFLMILIVLIDDGRMVCKDDSLLCSWMEIYHLGRNITFSLFHYAVGRDAIRFKQRDRRKCTVTQHVRRSA